jgi:hypothetical protein
MKVYYVANSRKVCSSIEQAVAHAVYDMGISYYKAKDRYVVSKPMVVENRWGEKKLIVTIYDTEYNKLKVKRRKIEVVDLDKECAVVVDYLGKF